MKKRLRRAFSIIELVIVIAIIAILAAVLIPTFSNVLRKADESADVQAVRNMNTALATAGEKPASVGEAIDAMTAAGFSDTFETYSAGGSLWWNAEQNVVVFKVDDEVKFPADYVKAEAETEYRLSFSGTFDTSDLSSGFAGGTGTAEDPFVIASEQSMNNMGTIVADTSHLASYGVYTNDPYVFKLERDITLENYMPIGDASFVSIGNGTVQENGATAFSGVFDGGGHTITLKKTAATSEYALFVSVYEATICNVTIQADIDLSENGSSIAGGVALYVTGVGAATFENITVNGKIKAGKHVGGVVGQYAYPFVGEVRFINCVNNADLYTSYNNASDKIGDRYVTMGGITAQVASFSEACYGVRKISDLESYAWQSSVSAVFVNCENHGKLTHQIKEGESKVEGVYSIIGQMVGQVATSGSPKGYSGAVSFYNEDRTKPYYTVDGVNYNPDFSTVTFENCNGDGEVTGYSVSSGINKFEEPGANANPIKLLFGGNASGIVIMKNGNTTTTYVRKNCSVAAFVSGEVTENNPETNYDIS